MTKLHITVRVTRHWWVIEVLSFAACYCWLSGRDQMPEAFIDWVVTHGFKLEVE